MISIQAKSQTEEKRLPGIAAEAIIWKIAERVGFQIQNGKGLFLTRAICTVAAVKQYRESTIWRNCRSGREIIDAARISGDIAKEFGVRHLLERRRSRILGSQRSYAGEQRGQEIQSAADDLHGRIILDLVGTKVNDG